MAGTMTQWMVYTNDQPSWHQRRAGHTRTGGMGFDTEAQAKAFVEHVLARDPSKTCYIMHETLTTR